MGSTTPGPARDASRWGDERLPVIDGYDVIRRLNAGGVASVYEGRRHSDGERVAIKVLARDRSTTSYDRFALEAQVGMRLDHPDIVRVHDHGETARSLWIAMDFLEGVDLSVAQHDPELGFSARLEVVVRVARALAAAHRAGILHRDVKPSNIFMKVDGGICLLDFGISKVSGFDLTQSHVISGTPGYIAPEQIQGQAVDVRADVFSLAVVAYELLSGHPPWARTTVYQTMLATCTQPPESLQTSLTSSERFALTPDVRKRAHQVIHRALAADRELRFDSADAFADALEELLRLHRDQRPAGDDSGTAIEVASAWAGRRLDWAKARAARAIREQADEEFAALETQVGAYAENGSQRDPAVIVWAVLLVLFIGGSVVALLRLFEV